MFYYTLRCLGLTVFALALVVTATGSPLKSKQPTLKDVEASPENFLGSRIVVDAWIGSEVKPADGSQELTVFHDVKTRAHRLRFLSPKSLADQVAALGGVRQATLTGTIAAPESVRAGYSFEVEEIAVKNADGTIAAMLKPAVLSAVKTDPTEPKKVESPAPKVKPAESQKKSENVPPILIVVAVGLGVFLLVSGVVGIRLMKHLKKHPVTTAATKAEKRPAPSRIKISTET